MFSNVNLQFGFNSKYTITILGFEDEIDFEDLYILNMVHPTENYDSFYIHDGNIVYITINTENQV